MSTDLLSDVTNALIPSLPDTSSLKLSTDPAVWSKWPQFASQFAPKAHHEPGVHGLSLEALVEKLYVEATGNDLPNHADVDAMYQRILALIEDDEDDVWTPEGQYTVTLKYTVEVTATVQAKTAEDAIQKGWDYAPMIKVGTSSELHDIDYDVEMTDCSADDA